MNCPKCAKVMYSKYRDGGSVLICYKCTCNFGQDFEMPNPNWIDGKIQLRIPASDLLKGWEGYGWHNGEYIDDIQTYLDEKTR